MFRTILGFGTIAGVIVAIPILLVLALPGVAKYLHTIFAGYLIMLLALTFVFVGVKRYRDEALGGVIKFVPAFLMGLGISVVAGLFYVAGWEIYLAATHYSYIEIYGRSMVEAARAKGASPAELAKLTAYWTQFAKDYANPLNRLLESFMEIFPVGFLVSLISAVLLRNRRFMPARNIPA